MLDQVTNNVEILIFEILNAKKSVKKKFFHKILAIFGQWILRDTKKNASVFLSGRTWARFYYLKYHTFRDIVE